MKLLILLVVLFVALARSQQTEVACKERDETKCRDVAAAFSNHCVWCPGTGCFAPLLDNANLSPCPLPDCRQATEETKCLSIAATPATVGSVVEKLCQWCPAAAANTAGVCLAKTATCPGTVAPVCERCDPALKPARICTDGTEIASTCNMDTCKWVITESDVCRFPTTCPNGCGETTMEAQLCSDQKTYARKICDLRTCSYVSMGCPDCNRCANVAKPELATVAPTPCADGSTSGLECVEATCEWKFTPCKIVDHPACPNGNAPAVCVNIIAPCTLSRCTDPEVTDASTMYCENDYCNGGCNAVWYKPDPSTANAYIKANCEPIVKIDCTDESHCPADKPTAGDCKEPKYICAALNDHECFWRKECPAVTPPPCDQTTCGGAMRDDLIRPCGGVEDGKWVCETGITLPFTNAEAGTSTTNADAKVETCDWAWKCPIPPVDRQCVKGGVCGTQCVSATTTDLPATNIEACKLALTCKDICFQTFVSNFDSCRLQLDGTCGFDFVDSKEYRYCVEKCDNANAPPPEKDTCAGSTRCNCDYSKCGWCRKSYTADVNGASTTFVAESCVPSTTPCLNDVDASTSVAFKAPERCYAVPTSITNDGTDTTTKPPIVKAVENINPVKIQEQLANLANTVPEVKDFIIAIKEQFTPTQDKENEVNVKIVVTISGPRDPSTMEQDIICRKVVIPGFQKASDDNNAKLKFILKNCARVVPNTDTTKRGVQQSSSSLLVESTGSPDTNADNTTTGSAATLFASFAVFVMAMVALLF